jgi:hypothetical protein
MRRVIAGRLVLSHIDMKPVDLDSDETEGFILWLDFIRTVSSAGECMWKFPLPNSPSNPVTIK